MTTSIKNTKNHPMEYWELAPPRDSVENLNKSPKAVTEGQSGSQSKRKSGKASIKDLVNLVMSSAIALDKYAADNEADRKLHKINKNLKIALFLLGFHTINIASGTNAINAKNKRIRKKSEVADAIQRSMRAARNDDKSFEDWIESVVKSPEINFSVKHATESNKYIFVGLNDEIGYMKSTLKTKYSQAKKLKKKR